MNGTGAYKLCHQINVWVWFIFSPAIQKKKQNKKNPKNCTGVHITKKINKSSQTQISLGELVNYLYKNLYLWMKAYKGYEINTLRTSSN